MQQKSSPRPSESLAIRLRIDVNGRRPACRCFPSIASTRVTVSRQSLSRTLAHRRVRPSRLSSDAGDSASRTCWPIRASRRIRAVRRSAGAIGSIVASRQSRGILSGSMIAYLQSIDGPDWRVTPFICLAALTIALTTIDTGGLSRLSLKQRIVGVGLIILGVSLILTRMWSMHLFGDWSGLVAMLTGGGLIGAGFLKPFGHPIIGGFVGFTISLFALVAWAAYVISHVR